MGAPGGEPPADAAIVDVHVAADLEAVLDRAGDRPVWIFKHSTICPVSAAANAAFVAAAAAGELAGAELARVRVIEDRPLSQAIARRFGVRHESPQALLVRRGVVRWHASHGAITREALRDAVRRECSGPVRDPR